MKTKVLLILIGITVFTVMLIKAPADETKKAEPVKKAVTAEAPAKTDDPFAFLPDVVATIGDRKISKTQFLQEVQPLVDRIKNSRQGDVPPDMWKRFAKQFTDDIIMRAILVDQAKASGIEPSSKLVAEEIDKSFNKIPPKQMEMVKKNFATQGTTLDKYKEKMSKDVLMQQRAAINKWVDTKIRPEIIIKESDVEKLYRENQERYKKPETVDASHILVKAKEIEPEKAKSLSEEEKKAETAKLKKDALEHAQKILTRLKQGEDFAKLASEESICPSGKKAGGNLGEFPRGRMIKEFEDVAFTLKPDELSNVVETKFGYHIIKISKHNKSSYVPYDEVKGIIKTQLKDEKISEKIRGIVEKEKKEDKVKIFI